MRRFLALAFVWGGCVQALGIEDLPVRPDGAAAGEDAPGDAPVLDGPGEDAPPLGPFGEPAPLAEVNSLGRDMDASLREDLLEIYFISDRDGDDDVWVARRDSTAEPFGAPENVTELNSPDVEGTPELSRDGLTMLFASTRPGGDGSYDIYRSTRQSFAEAWSAPARVPELCSPLGDVGPAMSVDERRMVLSSNREGTAGGEDPWASERSSTTGPWSTPVRIAELSSAAADGHASIPSPRWIFYGSRVADGVTDDLYVATRATGADPYEPGMPLAELNTLVDDEDPWVSLDMRVIVFGSNRAGSDDLYMATR